MDKLTELINAGPDRRYTMKAVVLSRFDDIVAARGLMRTWADIASALGFEGRGKDLSGCFLRVDAAIKKGKLKVPNSNRRVAQNKDHSEVQRISQVRRPLPGEIPVGDADEIAKALEQKGVVFK